MSFQDKFDVVLVNEKLEIEVPHGANLRDEAARAGVEVYQGFNRYANCVGHGTCGTCKVTVKKGAEKLGHVAIARAEAAAPAAVREEHHAAGTVGNEQIALERCAAGFDLHAHVGTPASSSWTSSSVV